MPETKEKILSIKDLWVRQGGHVVLESINLELFAGDFLGIIGPNGGGKSSAQSHPGPDQSRHRGEIDVSGLAKARSRIRICSSEDRL